MSGQRVRCGLAALLVSCARSAEEGDLPPSVVINDAGRPVEDRPGPRDGAASAPEPSSDAPAAGAETAAPQARLLISEIMYHAFLDEGPDGETHEFVEIHNRGSTVVPLAGWTLAGDIKFAFPSDAVIQAGQYLVVAKNRAKLVTLEKHVLGAAIVIGDYQGNLGNGGKNLVALRDPAGTSSDSVSYSAEFPWPLGADGLGVQPEWLPAAQQPALAHRLLGRSLERVSFDAPASSPDNWEASPLDRATPGRTNASAGMPRPIVMEINAAVDPTRPIRPADRVTVSVRFSAAGVEAPAIEYFVDDVARADEKPVSVALTAAGALVTAQLPPQPANSVVRYRVVGRRGGAMPEVISPRPSDPYAWRAYFVDPEPPGKTRAYHLFVAPADWTKLWQNCEPGWVAGCGLGENPTCASCAPNDRWDATVPAVFVYGGQVVDVQARYQGGKFSRLAGRPLVRWPHPAPAPAAWKTQALGWKVKFPRYARFENRQRSIRLNKRGQACTGIPDGVMSRVFESVGVPASRMRYARLYLNGGYYLYALEQESMNEEWLGRSLDERDGTLHNNNSIRWDQGPWGWGDFRLLQPFCGFGVTQRYAYSYELQSPGWQDGAELIKLIAGLHTARAAGDPALRAYLDGNFHRDLVLKYIAVINWAGAWDDDYHNHHLYKRRSDGKWMVMSSDGNLLLTGMTVNAANVTTYGDHAKSFYIGRQGEPATSNWRGRWNYLKDSFLRVFRAEYDTVLATLGRDALAPGTVDKYVDEMAADFDATDARASLSFQAACDDKMAGPTGVTAVKTYVRERHKVLVQRLGM